MKKLLIALLAVGALGFVPSAEAKRCEDKCKPNCETTEQRTIVQEPCYKWVKVKGTCPHEICTKVTTCTSESKKCVGDCNATCDNAAE